MGTLMDNIRRADSWSNEFHWQLRMQVYKRGFDPRNYITAYFLTKEDAQMWFNRQSMVEASRGEQGMMIVLDTLRDVLETPREILLTDYKDAGDFS